jgi:hypothetical protein
MPSGFPGGIFYVAPFQFSRGIVPVSGTLLAASEKSGKTELSQKVGTSLLSVC